MEQDEYEARWRMLVHSLGEALQKVSEVVKAGQNMDVAQLRAGVQNFLTVMRKGEALVPHAPDISLAVSSEQELSRKLQSLLEIVKSGAEVFA